MGAETPVPRSRPAPLLRPGLHVRGEGLPAHARCVQRHVLDEPSRNCYDATMEAFFSSAKSEVAARFESCGDAKVALLTKSTCSITSGAATRRSARSVRPN